MTVSRRRRWMLLGLLALGLTLALTLGAGLAQEPEGESEQLAPVSIEGTVANKFTYQGILREDGAPVHGTRYMSFRLYSDNTCTTNVSGVINRPNQDVSNGLFSVELAFSHGYFNGQELWLGVWVEGYLVACEEILPVPYALSLRPGADIVGTVDHLLELDNQSTSGGDIDTLIVRNDSGSGEAVEVGAVNNAVAAFAVNGFGVWGDSDLHHGVYGKTGTTAAAGVLARGYYQGADLLLGGNDSTGTGDDGRIHSDPQYPSSDIIVISNDTVSLYLDQDGDGEDADFLVYDKDQNLIFGVDESGDVKFGGPGIAAFPRPAYDSGWFALASATCTLKTHSIGGNVDNYVVDLQFKDTGGTPQGITNSGIGGDNFDSTGRGGNWRKLNTTTIEVCRWYGDVTVDEIRVRIWAYP